jgi:hypothetical protein
MKLKAMKLYQTIKVNGREQTFFTSDKFSIELDKTTTIITVKSNEGDITITSLSNMVWGKKVVEDNEPRKSEKSTTRAPKESVSKPKTKVGKSRVSKTK